MIKLILIFALLFPSTLFANDWTGPQENINPDSVITVIEMKELPYVERYRLDFWFVGGGHYIYISPRGCEFDDRVEQLCLDNLGKRFRDLSIDFVKFDNMITIREGVLCQTK